MLGSWLKCAATAGWLTCLLYDSEAKFGASCQHRLMALCAGSSLSRQPFGCLLSYLKHYAACEHAACVWFLMAMFPMQVHLPNNIHPSIDRGYNSGRRMVLHRACTQHHRQTKDFQPCHEQQHEVWLICSIVHMGSVHHMHLCIDSGSTACRVGCFLTVTSLTRQTRVCLHTAGNSA